MDRVRHDSGIEKPFRNGPWTTTEDEILIAYVEKHGYGNWNAVQKNSGLFRSGKSCRFRWVNYLKPNLKKGPFNDKEEKLIIQLHASMGNKWSRIAKHLPGRTDNEIKNFWHTRCKKLQRLGLPIYPHELAMNTTTDNHREPETAFPFMFGYETNKQSGQLWDYSFLDSTHILPDSYLFDLDLPSIQCSDSQEMSRDWRTQHFNSMPAVESDNSLVQSSHTPSYCPSSSSFDGLLESFVYGSSEERQTIKTESESPLLQSSLLGQTEFTTGHNSNIETNFSATSSNERSTSFDLIRHLLGEDRHDTEYKRILGWI